MANPGQQKRLADKLKRNLLQILTATDGLQVLETTNAAGDYLLTVTDGSWATADSYALIKIQEMPLTTEFPVAGFPVHKLMICVEADAAGNGTIMNLGVFGELFARAKDLGCAIEVYTSATTVQPADQATVAGTFNAGAATLKRHIRATVDAIGFGQ